MTATSLALVSSVPLTRGGLDADARRAPRRRDVVALARARRGPPGVFALAGERSPGCVLGDAYGGGGRVGPLVVDLAPWMVASIGVSVTFPLLFVRGRAAAAAVGSRSRVLLLHPFDRLARPRGASGSTGVALALAVTTALVLAGLLGNLGDPRAGGTRARARRGDGRRAGAPCVRRLRRCSRRRSRPPRSSRYAALLVLVRPAGLVRAWAYLRALR